MQGTSTAGGHDLVRTKFTEKPVGRCLAPAEILRGMPPRLSSSSEAKDLVGALAAKRQPLEVSRGSKKALPMNKMQIKISAECFCGGRLPCVKGAVSEAD